MKKQFLTLASVALIMASCGNSANQQNNGSNAESSAVASADSKVDWKKPLYAINENGDTITKWQYDDKGMMMSCEYLGEDPTSYYYNEQGDVIHMITDHGDNVLEYSYTYNDKGEKITEEDDGEVYNYTYKYDEKGRKTEVSVDGEVMTSYTYDDNAKTITTTTSYDCLVEKEDGRKVKYEWQIEAEDGMSETYEYQGNCETAKAYHKDLDKTVITKTYFMEK